MMVDEMADFFYQNLMGMSDSYLRATQDKALAESFKTFAKTFYNQFRASQLEQGAK
jgi:hypothetical protein